MVILLILIYSVSATGILFHEIVGLIIFALFLTHLFYNRKWVTNITKRIFDKNLGKKLKFMYFIDLLLFIMFILAGISGILISKELFKFGYVFIWRYTHIFSSTFSLLLLGIHVGLHIKMIIHTIKKHLNKPIIFVRLLTSLIAVIILGLGIYGITLSQNKNSLNTIKANNKNISIITLIKDTINIQESLGENSRKGINDRHEDNKRNEQKHEEKDGFNIKSVIIISMGFLSAIILCAIITYIIEYKIIKRLAKK